ncbi:hypothetical protein QIA17_00160 (plasmid) [Borreliella californiensis]|uniref:Uncharacterized protein n=1 Tax=Borreliella californiensis TaxID=373543 RepID=A0A7W9ZLF4_9SPIR|nr:hypothetical protein [Borreliella californiensis]MBB6213670.1 hypothetical protein [Borreliella californiensis]MBB6213693.1 hypothetical protein [Borreliella californiensis]WKC91253.1 hypothetical protein QIA17_00160 [Borreliella californiensis]WNY70913.1 hypothetical protein QIA39_04410 [Borreliella californiensis]
MFLFKRCRRCVLGMFYGFKKIKYDEFYSDFMFVNFIKKSKLLIKPYYIEFGG